MEIIGPLILSSIAGLATCLGIIFTFLKPKNVNRFICFSLSFAMGVMFFISIKELVPLPLINIYKSYNLLISIIITFILPIMAFKIVNLSKQKINSSNNLY